MVKKKKQIDYGALANVELISPELDRRIHLNDLIPKKISPETGHIGQTSGQGAGQTGGRLGASVDDTESHEKFPLEQPAASKEPPIHPEGLVIHLLRRGTCLLCRHQTEALNRLAQDFKALGFQLLIIVQDKIKVSELVDMFDEGQVWIDPNLQSFKALGHGKWVRPPKRQFFQLAFLKRIYRQMTRNHVSLHESTILGGYIVIWKEKILFDYTQEIFEKMLPVQDLLEVCQGKIQALSE